MLPDKFSVEEQIEKLFFDIYQHGLQEKNLRRFSSSGNFNFRLELLQSYASFFSSFASWRYFVTLTFAVVS